MVISTSPGCVSFAFGYRLAKLSARDECVLQQLNPSLSHPLRIAAAVV